MDNFQPYGIVVPMVTPFYEDGTLDLSALRRLTRRLIAADVDVLFPVGSSGEFFALTEEESQLVIETVVEEAAGRIPIYAGVGAISTRECIRRTQAAEALAVDAVVCITPFYITPSQDELYEHYAAIARNTRLPVIPYNNPGRTGGVNISPATLGRLAQIDNLTAIKDSSGNLAQTDEYIRETPENFSVFQGLDSIFFPSLVMGAAGCVAGTGNVIPEILVEMYSAFRAGDWETARQAQIKVTIMRQALALGTFPVVLKAAMELIGEPAGVPRAPVAPLAEPQKMTLSLMLQRMNIQIQANGKTVS